MSTVRDVAILSLLALALAFTLQGCGSEKTDDEDALKGMRETEKEEDKLDEAEAKLKNGGGSPASTLQVAESRHDQAFLEQRSSQGGGALCV